MRLIRSATLTIIVGLGAWPAAAALLSGVYETLPSATVEESGDSVRHGHRVVPWPATLTFDTSADSLSLTGVLHSAVVEFQLNPIELPFHSLPGRLLPDGTYNFTGAYLADFQPPQMGYFFDWRFSTSTNGRVVWNGWIQWGGGRIWYVNIANLTLVPQPRLSISRSGPASVQIVWATNLSDHVLEYATSLEAIDWNTVTNAVTTTESRLSVTVDTDASKRFYRLRKFHRQP